MSDPVCSDCGFPVHGMKPETIKKGSSVREPGEALCLSDSAKRSRMVREVSEIPGKLELIQALRMTRRGK